MATEIELGFDPETHTYTQNGIVVPSVTEIVGVALPFWSNSPDLQWLTQRGTAVHEALDFYEDGDLDYDELDERIEPYIAGWRKFVHETGWRTIAKEVRVDSLHYKFAGRADRIGTWPARAPVLTVLDIKTGDVVGKSAALQTAGYQIAWNSMRRGRMSFVRKRAALQLTEDGEYRVHHFTNDSDAKAFLAALAILNWRKLP